MKSRNKRKEKQSGMIFVLVILAVSLVVTAIYLSMSWMGQKLIEVRKASYRNRAQMLQAKITGLLQSDQIFSRVRQVNATSMACLSTPEKPCPRPPSVEAAPYIILPIPTPDGLEDLYDPNNQSAGFDLAGRTCKRYSESQPDTTCPFRYELKWLPDVSSDQKVRQDVEIVGRLRSALVEKIEFDSGEFGFNLFRKKVDGNIQGKCVGLGGKFDENSGKCEFAFSTGACGSGQFFVGIEPGTGAKKCIPSEAVAKQDACASTDVKMFLAISGFEKNGKAICESFNKDGASRK